MTLSEVLLWNELKQRKMLGYHFNRQTPIGNYIVDFYCKDLKLAIEIDGDTHIYRDVQDMERQKDLEKLGVVFLRFDDLEVKKGMWNVLRVIENWILKNKPTPDPSGEGNPEDEEAGLSIKENQEEPTPDPPPPSLKLRLTKQEGNPEDESSGLSIKDNHGEPTPDSSPPSQRLWRTGREGNPEYKT
jgi:very-short-patch-repair endonuclease